MQLNITTDYASRTDYAIRTDYASRSLLYLAMQNRTETSPAIAEAKRIPRPYQINIIVKLKRTEKIPLLDIIAVMEGTMQINRCLEHDRYCSRFATENCPVRTVYCAMQNAMEDSFRHVTLKNLQDQD